MQAHVDRTDERAVLIAHTALADGGVILYPTDTLYGLGADALSDVAVDRVYAIKGRDEGKPMHAIVADIEMAAEYAHIDSVAHKLAARFLPGALTLVLRKKEGINSGICRGIETIGLRIPNNAFCLELARAYGKPITATSANLAGHQPERSVETILKQLGVHADMIDCTVNAGELPPSEPSTVVDLSGERPIILREGAIPADEIWDELVELED